MTTAFVTGTLLAISTMGQLGGAEPQVLNPNNLPIGKKGSVQAPLGKVISTATGKEVTVDAVVEACKGKSFLFLGENHATMPHQQMQADLILGLVKAGRKVIVGLEMYTRPKQDFLDSWVAGKLTEEEFLTQSEWKTQWGFPYEFYKPVFEAARQTKSPMVALNVPRDWVRTTSRNGFEALPTSVRLQLPSSLDLTNKNHRMVFDSLMGGHSMGPASTMDKIYSSQVLWDEGMADSAIKYWNLAARGSETIFVVIAGSGHIMYGQGINYRLSKRGYKNGITLVMGQSDRDESVSKGIGEFFYLSKVEPKPVAK